MRIKSVALSLSSVLMLALGCLLIPNTSASTTSPNIVLIVVDSLRADHVSAYGYNRQTTPFIDSFMAAQGVRFQQVISTAPWTFPSNSANLTGYNPSSLGANWQMLNTGLPDNFTTLAEYLDSAGYYTAGFVSAFYLGRQHGLDQGFTYFDESLVPRPRSEVTGGDLTELATHWVQETWEPEIKGKQPLFLFLYYYDVHLWYMPPPPYDTLFDDTYTGTLTGDVYQDGQPVLSGEITPTPRDVEHLIAIYDGEIAYTDAQLQQMMGVLQASGVLDNALIVLTADHGEMFGEHGKWTHTSSLYEEVLHVPLLIRYPGVIPAGHVVDTPVQTMDFLPAVLEWAGVTVPEGLDAVSLRGLALGEPPGDPRLIYSEVEPLTDPNHPSYIWAARVPWRAVRSGEWKLIHQFNDGGTQELYRLGNSSPYETENLVGTEPQRASNMWQLLRQRFLTNNFYQPLIVR